MSEVIRPLSNVVVISTVSSNISGAEHVHIANPSTTLTANVTLYNGANTSGVVGIIAIPPSDHMIILKNSDEEIESDIVVRATSIKIWN